MDMTDKFQFLVSILFGLCFFLWRSKLADVALRQWNKKLPEARNFWLGYLVSFYIAGIAFIIFGTLGLFGLIKLKY